MSAHSVALSTGESFLVADGERILAAGRRAGVWLPFECGWGSCGTCKATLIDGEVETLFPGAPAIKPRDARRRRILVCQTTPRSDLVLDPGSVAEAAPEGLAVEDRVGTVVANDDLGPDVRRLEIELDRAVPYRAGQYAIVELGPRLRRCYSMASPFREGRRRIVFIYKRYGTRPGSTAMWRLAEGDSVRVEMPYGGMWVRDGRDAIVMVAGGTGIAPMLAMVAELAGRQDERAVEVIYGAGSADELVAANELKAAIESLREGRVRLVVESPDRGFADETGTVVDVLAPLASARYYVAGPPRMVEAVLGRLRDGGVGIDRIAFDSFG